ncbi:MAG: NAD(P)-binding domain-containing protein, partial [Deltaproteobacteria bacterium]|nr:NAD(P)-binding domain-containing protein [Deltaproteobacteria bacterium]
MKNMGVIGGGSWGTALALLLAVKGYPVTLWTYEEQVAQDINQHHENRSYLPGFPLPDHLMATNDLLEASMEKDMVVLVTPSQHMRPVLE